MHGKIENFNSDWNRKDKNIKSGRQKRKKQIGKNQQTYREEEAKSPHRNFYLEKFQNIGLKLVFLIFAA